MERPTPSNIPTTPGVYLYKDANGRIIYVGKARNLRKRVLSYFRPPSQLTPKTIAMVGHAASLEYLSTHTEKEALLLESSLIKKHRPRYNIVLRDDKQYVLFRLSNKDEYPRLEITRKAKKRDGARYFGPFTSSMAARETWKSIHRLFPLRRCSDRAMRNRVKPCLYHHINLCLAPCTGEVSPEEYRVLTNRVGLLLEGRSRDLLDILQKQMDEAAEQLDFERAAEYRDQLQAIEKTLEKQGVVLNGGGDMDVLGLTTMPGGLALGLIFVRQGRMLDRSTFFWPGLGLEEAGEVLWSFLSQYYGPNRAIPPRIVIPWVPGEDDPATSPLCVLGDSETQAPEPDHLSQGMEQGPSLDEAPWATDAELPGCGTRHSTLPDLDSSENIDVSMAPSTKAGSPENECLPDAGVNSGKDDDAPVSDADEARNTHRILEDTLAEIRGGPVHINAPRNADEHRLVDMAKSNAREAARGREDIPLSQRLALVFQVPGPIIRIECVDVSHTGGQATKVGVVVYDEGKAAKDDYRVWNVDGAGGDDYAALTIWAGRRFEHGPVWPDLLLVDGGKGQLAAVHKVFHDSFNGDIPFLIAGIAKARDEMGRADRRAGNLADRIFVPGRSNPLPLREGSAELLYLQAVRDAAHDFSIGKHRQARAKLAFSGELQRLSGIGPGTAKLLWDNFDSIEAMKAASREDIAKLPGIGPKKADKIWHSLQSL